MNANVTTGTLVRTACLAVTLINSILTASGHSPLPFDDEQTTAIVSTVLTTAAALAAWWKNNSFTSEAIRADRWMKREKEKNK